jgi:hypothetical protein
MKLRIAASTKRFIDAYNHDPTHAILLIGVEGAGLHALARHMADTSGTLLADIEPQSKTATSLPVITVERIRQLYEETRSYMNGVHFVIIDDAEKMNTAAQNALLKLLEEPNSSIRFILTSHAPDSLLATIRSRVQLVSVSPIDPLDTSKLLSTLKVTDATDIQRFRFIAEGLPAEITRLATNPKAYKELTERVQVARTFVTGTAYDRYALTYSLKEDRGGAIKLIETIIMLLRSSIKTNPDKETVQQIERMLQASESIRANGNVKLQLAAAV